MINNHIVEQKLGLRFYSGGASSQQSQSQNIGGSASQYSSRPQLTPDQLVSLYSTAMPQVLNATTAGAQNIANTENNLINGPGGQAATNAVALNNQLNPAQATANQAAIDASNAINLNGLSPGEQNAVERGLNQSNQATGNLGLNNETNNVANAMNFGGAFNQKVGMKEQAANTAANVAGAQNAQVNPMSLVNNAVSAPLSFGSSTFGQLGSAGSTPISQGTSTAFNQGSGSGSGSSMQVGLCCFIFLEAYFGELPWWVRLCRDKYYTRVPNIALGYRKMAIWLVPLMRRYGVVRWLVWKFMVLPLTLHGLAVVRHEVKLRHKFARTFWFTVWAWIGKE